ncbi:MAG: adenylate/guanylate cyclase domain-containing protein [Bacteroidia bacterium]
MKKILFPLLFSLVIASSATSADSTFTLIFKDPLPATIDITEEAEILFDSSGRVTIEQLLNDVSINKQFVKQGNLNTLPDGVNYYWRKFKVVNQMAQPVMYYVPFKGDSIWVYEMDYAKTYIYISGTLVHPSQRPTHHARVLVPIFLRPGEVKTYYIRAKSQTYPPARISGLKLQSEKAFRYTEYFSSFHAGAILLLILVGLFLCFIFRDKVYFVLILPVVAILIWFSENSGLLDQLVGAGPFFSMYSNTAFSAWFLPCSCILFLMVYIDLKQKMKWAYYFGWIAIGVIIFMFMRQLALPHTFGDGNRVLLPIIIFLLGLVIYRAFKKDKQALIWVLFMAPFLLSGIIFIVNQQFFKIPLPLGTYQILQISSLLSALIIGYALYDRVNSTIKERVRAVKDKERLVKEQNIVLEQKVEERTRELEAERQKSEDILLNILPQEVAEELKETGGSQAKLFENVTVLFTDFVDFTKAGERMAPRELVNELHNCFKAFDEIIQQHGLEKIKTVGDAYIAVAGLPVPVKGHAARVAKAALEIRDFMVARQKLLKDNTFQVRLGIHSGPVVAGIVGVKKFAYDIWGDTVNTAARMEQCSEAGEVNISETTYGFIKGQFECTCRGVIAAKNKGKMQMYFVKRENQANVLKAITKEVI